MRVLVTTDLWFPDYMGGSARVARETAVALAARGHEVVVAAPKASGQPAMEVADGVRVHRIVPSGSVLPRTATNVLMFRRALAKLDAASFDVVLAHHPPNAVAAITKGHGPPVAYVFHASARRESRFRRARGTTILDAGRGVIVEPISGVLERVAAKRAETVLILSEFSRGVLCDDDPDAATRAINVGGGVDTEKFHPARDRDAMRVRGSIAANEIVLLTVRRLVSRMGIDVLIRAVADVKAAFTDVRLVIVGDGEELTNLQHQTKELGLADTVTFTGRLSDEDVIAWYQVADLFILPTVAYEGFGMVSAEALACGTPVIGTRVGATPEILERIDPELLAQGSDATNLAQVIRSTVPKLDSQFRAKCRAEAEQRLAWTRVIEAWESALEEASVRE